MRGLLSMGAAGDISGAAYRRGRFLALRRAPIISSAGAGNCALCKELLYVTDARLHVWLHMKLTRSHSCSQAASQVGSSTVQPEARRQRENYIAKKKNIFIAIY